MAWRSPFPRRPPASIASRSGHLHRVVAAMRDRLQPAARSLLLPPAWRNAALSRHRRGRRVRRGGGRRASCVLGLPLSGVVATSGAVAVILGLALQHAERRILRAVLNIAAVSAERHRVDRRNRRADRREQLAGDEADRTARQARWSCEQRRGPRHHREPQRTVRRTHGTLARRSRGAAAVVIGARARAASSLDVLARPRRLPSRSPTRSATKLGYVDALRRRRRAQLAVRSRASASRRLWRAPRRRTGAAGTIGVTCRAGCTVACVDLFARVDGDDLAALADALVPRSFGRGDVIYASNGPRADDRRIRRRGRIRARRATSRCGAPGDAIGQSVVLAARAHACGDAVTACSCAATTCRR